MYKHIFEPMEIRGIKLKNRITKAPFLINHAEQDGSVSKRMVEHYSRLAAGGASLIMVEATAISSKGVGFPYGPMIDRDDVVEGFQRVSKVIKDEEAVACLQIFHAGRFAPLAESLAPSPVPFSPVPMFTYSPREMTKEEIKSTIKDFAMAALRAKKAGFDMVELHGGTGYLLGEFVSPYTNRRQDEYGGPLNNRMRFPLEVLKAVKEEVGDMPVGYRFMADELLPHGFKLEEAKLFAKELERAGIAYLSVTAGTYESYIIPEVEEFWRKIANCVPMAHEIKKGVSCPVFVAGRIIDPQTADDIIREGKAHCVALARPLFADPQWPKKALENKAQEIIKCIACGLCMSLVGIRGKEGVCSQWKIKERKYTSMTKRIPLMDGIAKVTGDARYTLDISLPKMLWGKILRSIHPHARILHIDTSKAQRLPGVKAVVTAQDCPDVKYGFAIRDQIIIARDKVRYFGEPIAAVAAIDKDIAQEALDLIDVEYEKLPAVFDPIEAMKEEAPIIHEDLTRYERELPWWEPIQWGNVCSYVKICQGDVEKGFQESDYIFEDSFATPNVHQCYLETHAALVNPDAGGNMDIWAAAVAPFSNQLLLSRVLKIPMTKIRYISPYLGASYGGKYYDFIAPHCVLLAQKAGRPIKMDMRREEEFIGGTPRHPAKVEIKTGIRKDGTLMAKQIKAIYDTGAYADVGPMMMSYALTLARGPYEIPNCTIEGYCVYTNKMPNGSFRGWGNPQVAFPSESQMDIMAERLGMDPYEIRRKNGIETGDTMVTGQVLQSVALKETLRGGTLHADWDGLRKKEKGREGIGMACIDAISGFASSSALIRMNEDGTFELMTGAVDGGQGSSTTLVQIAAEELGITPGDITMAPHVTSSCPWDLGVVGSRTIYVVGNAVRTAAVDLKRQLLALAGEMLKTRPDDLEIRDKVIRKKGAPRLLIPIPEVYNFALWGKDGPIIGRGSFNPIARLVDRRVAQGYSMTTMPAFIYATQIAQVSIDRETGKVNVSNIVAAHDCGKAVNPTFVESQIQGAIATGLGYALSEEMLFDEGRVLNSSFTTYGIPTALDVPLIEPVIIEVGDSTGPFGAKGVGEPGTAPTAPAIANAIADAIGIRLKELPLTPEKILDMIELEGRKGGL